MSYFLFLFSLSRSWLSPEDCWSDAAPVSWMCQRSKAPTRQWRAACWLLRPSSPESQPTQWTRRRQVRSWSPSSNRYHHGISSSCVCSAFQLSIKFWHHIKKRNIKERPYKSVSHQVERLLAFLKGWKGQAVKAYEFSVQLGKTCVQRGGSPSLCSNCRCINQGTAVSIKMSSVSSFRDCDSFSERTGQ